MSTSLAERKCIKCEPGTPPLDGPAIQRLLPEVPGWTLAETASHPVLTRTYKFKGFMPGVDLVNRIAAIAEEEGHHPDLQLGWGYLTVELWTHAAGGLTDNDFIVAAKVERAQSSKS
jgi:4a-hydroxytetrahydrobiopterin dehydratase